MSSRFSGAVAGAVRKLHVELWTARGRLLGPDPHVSPLQLLDLSVVAQFLGLEIVYAESLGTVYHDGVEHSVAGVLDRDGRRILVCTKFPEEVQRFTIAHEIGHWLLHRDLVLHRDRPVDREQTGDVSRVEREANEFAAKFLMPERLFRKEFEVRFGPAPLELDSEALHWIAGSQAGGTSSASAGSLPLESRLAGASSFRQVPFGSSLAMQFGVSREAAGIRLRELNLLKELDDPHALSGLTWEDSVAAQGRNIARLAYSALPVVSQILHQRTGRQELRLVVMQHAIRDTCEFLESCRAANIQVGEFLAKPNSLDEEVANRIERMGIPVLREPPETPVPYAYFEQHGVLDQVLQRQLAIAEAIGRRLVLVDVGGYFLAPLLRNPEAFSKIAGIVEVTTYGHLRYFDKQSELMAPTLSIARSALKYGEAIFVGLSSARAIEDILQSLGRVLAGQRCTVVGYGMIGREVAQAVAKRGAYVTVVDRDPLAEVRARLEGFNTGVLADALGTTDIVVCATGNVAIGPAEFGHLRDGVLLASAGSRKQEIVLAELRSRAEAVRQLERAVTEYQLSDCRRILIANGGKAVNFMKDGTPEEVMDLVFAEIADGIAWLAEQQRPLGKLLELPDERRRDIADLWLRLRRHHLKGVG